MQTLQDDNVDEYEDQQKVAAGQAIAKKGAAVAARAKKNQNNLAATGNKKRPPGKGGGRGPAKKKPANGRRSNKKKSKAVATEDDGGDEETDDDAAVQVDHQDSESVQLTVVSEEEEENHIPKVGARKKQQQQPSVLSKDAMKAAKGNRAGVQGRTDEFGCDHWGIEDIYHSGGLDHGWVKRYLEEGEFLHGNKCRGCGKPAEKLDKTQCEVGTKKYCFICEPGQKQYEECDCFFCYPCLKVQRAKLVQKRLEEGGGVEGRGRRSLRNVAGG